MKVEVENLSVEDLNKKIEAIKAEREKTANALKRYEEELERRKQEKTPLGVPLGEGRIFGNIQDSFKKIYATITLEEVFESIKSSDLFFERLKTWRKALVANAKGEPIGIEVLSPLLKKGWVFYQGNINTWLWSDNKPTATNIHWEYEGEFYPIYGFNIKPAEDWRNSLMECGL